MKRLTVILLIWTTNVQGQTNQLSVSIRVPLQVDFQKAEITYGPDKIQKNTSFNFGVESIIERRISAKMSISAGLGYFRQRFNIQRPYDHQTLNPGTDSLPIIINTNNYHYNLLRVPIGTRYIFSSANHSASLGIEYIPSFSFSNVYNGDKPFESASQKKTNFFFFSHAVNLSARFPLKIKALSRFQIEPFIRILHSYKGDPVLHESSHKMIFRSFDALGIILAYQFNIRQ